MKNETLSAPALTEAEASALTALLTAGTATPANLDADAACHAALVNVASARDALWTATGSALGAVGSARWGMAIAVYGAVEAGASRLAVAETAGINRSIVGQYVRFPERLAEVADALGVERSSIVADAQTIEAVWSYGSRLNTERWATFCETLTGLVVNAEKPVESWEYVALTASTLSMARGSRSTDTEAEAEADAETQNGETLTVRETELAAAIALILSIHGDDTATDAERVAIHNLVATLTA